MENKSCCSSGNTNKLKSKAIKIKPKAGVNKTNTLKQASCCCGSDNNCCEGTDNNSKEIITQYSREDSWIIGEIETGAGIVPKISTELSFNDKFGTWKVRWGINRMNYRVNPGLYAVGTPDSTSPVLVTANYKLTFDSLRKELTGINAWIMVLDTKGVNVWCAAGKGTFGTEELLVRIAKTKLSQLVTHKTLVLPQLGAPGVSAHEITKNSGFKVVYGPIRASDIKEFIDSGMKASAEMRSVKFTAYDRLILAPMELVGTFKISLMIFGILFLLNLIAANPFGITEFYTYAGALIAGCVLTPVLLPLIPGKAFAWKGWIMGLIWTAAVILLNSWFGASSYYMVKSIGYLLVFPSVSSFYAMNFTGSSTYTSLSGVLKEMKVAVPAIITSLGLGILLLLISSFM